MNDKSILDGQKMRNQSGAAIVALKKENEELEELKVVYRNISMDSKLEGEAADAMRQHMLACYDLVDVCIRVNEDDIADHMKLYDTLTNEYYDGGEILRQQSLALAEKSRDEAERDKCRDEWLNNDNILVSSANYWRYLWYCGEVNRDEREYQYWLAKEKKFDEFESATAGLFADSVSIRDTLDIGIMSLNSNFDGFSYQIDSNKENWESIIADYLVSKWKITDENGLLIEYDYEAIYEAIGELPDISDAKYEALNKVIKENCIFLDPPVNKGNLETKLLEYTTNIITSNAFMSSEGYPESPYDRLSPFSRFVYVALYEKYNAEDTMKMNLFLKDIPKGVGTDVNGKFHSYEQDNWNIRFIVYTAPEEYRKLFLENVEGITVQWDCNFNPKWKGEKQTLYIDLDGYVDSEGNKCAGESNNPRGAYVTLFHEFGHSLDDRLGDGELNGKGYLSEQADLTKIICEEVKEDIAINLKEYCSKKSISVDDDQIKIIANSIICSGSVSYTDWTEEMIKAYEGLLEVYNGNDTSITFTTWDTTIISESYEGITDVYCGVTDNKIDWGYGHRNYVPSYWYSTSGALNSSVGKEFTAEAFSHYMTNSPKGQIYYTNNVLDNSLNEVDKMFMEK